MYDTHSVRDDTRMTRTTRLFGRSPRVSDRQDTNLLIANGPPFRRLASFFHYPESVRSPEPDFCLLLQMKIIIADFAKSCFFICKKQIENNTHEIFDPHSYAVDHNSAEESIINRSLCS